jgi:hypothetical protein
LIGDRIVVDVSALATPAIFDCVRTCMNAHQAVGIVHTRAVEYYPIDSEIAPILDAERDRDHYRLLDRLGSVMKGESAPYTLVRLLNEIVEPSRRRVLIAFASAKHERLLSLLEQREYDSVEIIGPDGKSARSQLAGIAAQVAVDSVQSGSVTLFGSYDLDRTIEHVLNQYRSFYVHSGFNVELGVTGSKLQTVACAAVSASVKVGECWYVRPESYDDKTFTRGVGATRCYRLSVPSNDRMT